MVLDIKICLPCEACHRAFRQLPMVKADGGYKGPENVYAVYARMISAQSSLHRRPPAST